MSNLPKDEIAVWGQRDIVPAATEVLDGSQRVAAGDVSPYGHIEFEIPLVDLKCAATPAVY